LLVSVLDEVKAHFYISKEGSSNASSPLIHSTVLFILENGGIPGLPQAWHSIWLCTPTSLEMIEHRLVGILSNMTILEQNTLSFLHGHGYSQNTIWAESILTNAEQGPFPDSKGS
jgi:hypothetical protein